MWKYTPLKIYLENTKEDEITLTFEEIEKIINEKLPDSAYKHSAFWANEKENTSYKVWIDAKWKTKSSNDFKYKKMTFLKGTKGKSIKSISNTSNKWKRINNWEIPYPCPKEVLKYLNEWNDEKKNEKYILQEKALNKIFLEVFPLNNDINEVLIKVATLDTFYSTWLRFSKSWIVDIAKHIISLKIDERLKNNDLSLVNDIANLVVDWKVRNNYSFATKYCSHHKSSVYPIYDDFVKDMLYYFHKLDLFADFKKETLKEDYNKFYEIIIQFQKYYWLTWFTLKQIDQYLWLAGKKYFAKK